MADSNKVVFGISNVHYAVYDALNNKYETPVAIPGAVSLSVTREGSVDDFYADNTKYASFETRAGYSGSLEIAYAEDQMLIDLLGYQTINGVLVDADTDATIRFALLYEVSSNVSPDRFVFYDCVLSRPESDANTRTDSTDPDTQTLDITMSTHKFSDTLTCAKGKCTQGDSNYDGWYEEVVLPAEA